MFSARLFYPLHHTPIELVRLCQVILIFLKYIVMKTHGSAPMLLHRGIVKLKCSRHSWFKANEVSKLAATLFVVAKYLIRQFTVASGLQMKISLGCRVDFQQKFFLKSVPHFLYPSESTGHSRVYGF